MTDLFCILLSQQFTTTLMCQRCSRACLHVVIMCREHQYNYNYTCPFPADQIISPDQLTMDYHHRYDSMYNKLVSLLQAPGSNHHLPPLSQSTSPHHLG